MTTIMEQVASRLVSAAAEDPSTQVFRQLVAALDQGAAPFDIQHLYALNAADFELALALIADWRFRRHLHAAGGGLRDALAHTRAPKPHRKQETLH
jgi:hypothetical protein